MSLRKRRFYEFLPYIHLLNGDGLLGRYCLIGGFASEAWRSIYFQKLSACKSEWDKLGKNEQKILRDSIQSKDIDFRAAVDVVNAFRRGLKYKQENRLRNRRLHMDSITFEVFDDPKDKLKPNAHDEYSKQIGIMDRLEGIDPYPMTVGQGITTVEKVRNELTGHYEDVSILDPLSLLLIKHQATEGYYIEGKDRQHLDTLSVVIPLYLKQVQADFKAGKIHRDPAIIANRLRNKLRRTKSFSEIITDPARFQRLLTACDEVAQSETRELYEENISVILPNPSSNQLNLHRPGKIRIVLSALRKFGDYLQIPGLK